MVSQNERLRRAARDGLVDDVVALLRAGANPSVIGENDATPLHDAARRGHPEACKALLDHGVNVGITETTHRMTPLHLAALHGHWAVCELLLKRGAMSTADDRGVTPLHFAAGQGNAAICALLLEAGADPHAVDKRGWTPLHEAAALWGTVAVIDVLVKAGARPDAKDKEGQTPEGLARCDDIRRRLQEAARVGYLYA